MPPKYTAQANQPATPAMPWPIPGGEPIVLMTRLQASAFKAMLKWQIESLNFLRHRCEQDMRFVDELLQSPEPGEVMSACSCFMQNALDDYSKEAVKAANYSGKIVTDAAREFRTEAGKLSENAMVAAIA